MSTDRMTTERLEALADEVDDVSDAKDTGLEFRAAGLLYELLDEARRARAEEERLSVAYAPAPADPPPWGSLPGDATDPNYGRVCSRCGKAVRRGERYDHVECHADAPAPESPSLRSDVPSVRGLIAAAVAEERLRAAQYVQAQAYAEHAEAVRIKGAMGGIAERHHHAFTVLTDVAAHILHGDDYDAIRSRTTEQKEDPVWPVEDLLRILAAATRHLLRDHNCDHMGYEAIDAACTAAEARTTEQKEGEGAGERDAAVRALLRELEYGTGLLARYGARNVARALYAAATTVRRHFPEVSK
jgi:hypothetical protein